LLFLVVRNVIFHVRPCVVVVALFFFSGPGGGADGLETSALNFS